MFFHIKKVELVSMSTKFERGYAYFSNVDGEYAVPAFLTYLHLLFFVFCRQMMVKQQTLEQQVVHQMLHRSV